MKKFFPLVLIILVFVCSSDNNELQEVNDKAEAYFGTWVLVESNINPSLDANNDGTTSRNLLDKLECLTGTIVLNDNFKFTSTSLEPTITGYLYIVSCSSPTADLGLGAFVDDAIVLKGNQDIVFEVSGNRMTFTGGLDLPEV